MRLSGIVGAMLPLQLKSLRIASRKARHSTERGIREYLATVSPFRDVDKIGCGAAKRLCNSHRQSHAYSEFRDTKVPELIRSAVQTFCHLLPRGSVGTYGGRSALRKAWADSSAADVPRPPVEVRHQQCRG
jgi:hypothetical protein